jgi:hypothetical protein
VWLYALQIYFDFSAYTDMARGTGLLFGYRWPENFNRPYLAANVSEFWRRWHMTLSRFLRDYLYIALGGNRHGAIRTHLNLMLTMLLGGLWHGASWTFLVWGGLHGSFLIVHRLWAGTALASALNGSSGWVIWHAVSVALTFHAVCFAWCFFRLARFPESVACIRKWVVCDAEKMWLGPWTDPAIWLALFSYLALVRAAAALRASPGTFAEGAVWGVRFGTLALAALLAPGGASGTFIYFQFECPRRRHPVEHAVIEVQAEVQSPISRQYAGTERDSERSDQVQGGSTARTGQADSERAEIPGFFPAGPGRCVPPEEAAERQREP